MVIDPEEVANEITDDISVNNGLAHVQPKPPLRSSHHHEIEDIAANMRVSKPQPPTPSRVINDDFNQPYEDFGKFISSNYDIPTRIPLQRTIKGLEVAFSPYGQARMKEEQILTERIARPAPKTQAPKIQQRSIPIADVGKRMIDI